MSTNPNEGMGQQMLNEQGRIGEGEGDEGGQRGQGGGQLREELNRLGQAAKDTAYQQVDYLREQGRQRAQQLEDRIIEEPLKSVGIALGVGFLLGMMWRR